MIPFTRFLWDSWSQHLFFLSALVIIAAVYAEKIFSKKSLIRPHLPLSLIGFVFFLLLSGFLSPFKALSRNHLTVWISSLLLFFMVTHMSEESKLVLKRVLCAVVCLVSLLFLAVFFLSPELRSTRGTEFFLNDNCVASLSLIGLFIALDLYQSSRGLAIITALSASLVFVLTQSLAGSIGILFGLLYLSTGKNADALSKKNLKVVWSIVLPFAIFSGISAWFNSPWLSGSVEHRLNWWTAAVQMIGDRPFFGYGPGSFDKVALHFDGHSLKSVYAHNFVLQTASEIGVPAAIAWLVFLFHKLKMVQSRYLTCGLIAVFVQNLFDFSLNVPGILFLFLMNLSLGLPAPSVPPQAGFVRQRTPAIVLFVLILTGWSGWRWGAVPLIAFHQSFKAQESYLEMNLNAAEKSLRTSIELDPLPSQTYSFLSRILLTRYRKDSQNNQVIQEAISMQEEALRREPTSKLYRQQMEEMLTLSNPEK